MHSMKLLKRFKRWRLWAEVEVLHSKVFFTSFLGGVWNIVISMSVLCLPVCPVTWWDWRLILRTYFLSVLWHCWLGHFTGKTPSPIWPIMTCLVHGTLNLAQLAVWRRWRVHGTMAVFISSGTLLRSYSLPWGWRRGSSQITLGFLVLFQGWWRRAATAAYISWMRLWLRLLFSVRRQRGR